MPNHCFIADSSSYFVVSSASSLTLAPSFFFFFNATAPTEIYTLSLHDALPISNPGLHLATLPASGRVALAPRRCAVTRSEEHTSELQSLTNLVCRLLLEKKKKKKKKKQTQRPRIKNKITHTTNTENPTPHTHLT